MPRRKYKSKFIKFVEIKEGKIEFDLVGNIEPELHVIVKFDMHSNGNIKNIRVRTKILSNGNI